MKKNETRIISYCAVFQAEEDGINIDFPDLQGCLSCSFSQEDSIKMAEEALSLWLDGQKYEDLPQPTLASNICCRSNEIVFSVSVQVQIVNGIIDGRRKHDKHNW